MKKSASKVDSSANSLQPTLNVTAQQSRYALDCLDAPTTKEVLIKDLSISMGRRELLNRTKFHIVEGGRYVLVGRNGEGKSTLLRALANKQIPGVPLNLRILLLGQTRDVSAEEALSGLKIEEETVLGHVIRSNVAREENLAEEKQLSEAMDMQDSDPTQLVKVYRRIQHRRLLKQFEDVKNWAERRSGAKGKNMRYVQVEMEEKILASQASLDEDLTSIDPAVLSKQTQDAADMLIEVQSQLEMIDAAAAESRARTVLLGLGFKPEQIDGPKSKLSGGWQTRCELACALCQTCDILLLDEPTNFLDLPSIIWLQQYINGDALEGTTVVTVTHDRDFADAVAQELLILRHQKIEVFKGNLSRYESEKLKKIKWLSKMKDAKDKQKKHIESSIQGNIQAARRSGDDKKLKQAVSRQKKLDERWGMEVNAKGHRFKLNRDLGGYHLSNRSDIDVPDFDPLPKIKFPTIPPDLRFPGALVSLENVSFRYSRSSAMVLQDVNLTIHYGQRYGLAGLNGSGKTTLVQLLDGSTPPTTGTVTRHPRVRIARFSQLVVEELHALAARQPSLTALAHLLDLSGGALAERDARAVLGGVGLAGPAASDVPLRLLSGGQAVRVALAGLVWNAAHLLVLDEVTTHLDGETILGLMGALREYEGAVVVVTHDRFFMRCVVEGESPAVVSSRAGLEDMEGEEQEQDSDYEEALDKRKGEVWRVFKGGLRKLDGGMGEYEDIAERAAERLTKKMGGVEKQI